MGVRIVGDSTSYLAPQQIADYRIEQVSLSVVWNDRSVPELEIGDLASFYDQLRAMEDLPGTSQPSVGQFLDAFEPILSDGDDVVSLHFSSGISGTFESAVLAKQELERRGLDPGRVSVIDTGSACGGYGLVLMAAGAAAARGCDRQQVVDAARAMIEAHGFWFAVDTLEYLRRGGRIGAVASAVGGAMRIKPILTVDSSGILPVERVRTESRVLGRIGDLAEEHMPRPDGGFIVQHVQAPERAKRVIDDLSNRFGEPPAFVPAEIGPVIGAHVGPGLVGVGVFPAEMIAL